jgi:FkbM family methyltransferase
VRTAANVTERSEKKMGRYNLGALLGRTVLVGYGSVLRLGKWFVLKTNTRYSRVGKLAAAIDEVVQRYMVRRFPLPNPMVVHGKRIYYPPGSISSGVDLMWGLSSEPGTRNYMISGALRPGMTIVDVGAHIGFYTLLAASKVAPNGRVFAFEPDPLLFRLLLKNIESNCLQGVVAAVDRAVSDGRLSCAPFFQVPADVARTGGSLSPAPGFACDVIPVDTISLDEFFADKPSTVDLVKIDTEGWEKRVLNGMRGIVRLNPHIKVVIELMPHRLRGASTTPTEVYEVLQEMGFVQLAILDPPPQGPLSLEGMTRLEEQSDAPTINILCEQVHNS